MHRPHFDYVRTVRHIGQLVKECLLNTLTVPARPPRARDSAPRASPELAYVPLLDDHRAHMVLRADITPPTHMCRYAMAPLPGETALVA